jgi:hypothetical protein
MYALSWGLLVLVTAQQRPSLHLTLSSPVRLTDVDRFRSVLERFDAGEVEASACLLTAENEGTVKELDEWGVEVRTDCKEARRQGVYVNGRLSNDPSKSLIRDICAQPAFLSRKCFDFCPQTCNSTQTYPFSPSPCLPSLSCKRLLAFNETCPSACTSQLLSNSLCDPECDLPGCNHDGGLCICPSYCTALTRTSEDCDLTCNTTACNYDDSRCIEGGGDEGDPSWVKWVIGSLSIVCFL